MKGYVGGTPVDVKRRPRKMKGVRQHANVMIAAAVIISIIMLGAVMLPNPTLPQQRAQISWTTTTIDSYADVGAYCSLVISPAGNFVEIDYYNVTAGDYKYAYYAGAWVTGTGYSTGDVGRFTTNARDSIGTNYVCFYDASNGDLLYGNSLGDMGAVDTAGDVGQFASMAVNSATGTLAVSYYNASSGDLKVAVNTSGAGWVNKTIDSFGDVGLYTDLVFLGTNDTISILYYNATAGSLKNAWQWGGTSVWQSMTIDSMGDVGRFPSQFAYNFDSWWASYYDATNGNLKFQSYIGTDFTIAVPDSVGDVGSYTSIGVNSTGHVFISYRDVTNDELKIAWNESTTWYNMTLDSAAGVGYFTSLKIDSSDRIHIAYYDAALGNLKYILALPSEFVIPEFGTIIIPIVGTMAVVALIIARRKQE